MVERARAQTTLDFATGMGIFLLVLVVAFGFLPSVFTPFSGDGDAQLMTADRSAARLTEELLGSPTEPTQLDRTCTVAFFAGDAPPEDCRYTTSDLTDALAVEPGTHVQVAITEIADGQDVVIDETTLRRGLTPPSTGDVNVARRLVSIDGTTYQLVVQIW